MGRILGIRIFKGLLGDGHKKRVSNLYRTATTRYRCFDQDLAEFPGSWSYRTYPSAKFRLFSKSPKLIVAFCFFGEFWRVNRRFNATLNRVNRHVKSRAFLFWGTKEVVGMELRLSWGYDGARGGQSRDVMMVFDSPRQGNVALYCL